ncbi:MAG: outer membrane channel superfamily protein [Flavobacteriaceae bacterium CG_4_8_14_3_um_filter_34_10]|nr:porin family protein [Flavobacteriia bacterium]PIX10173.1 MAG: outer membrane channel superfamily protein [Flavobacteriaceae bacterium CG_4_8_14_3_um_filter_34_10]PIZ07592.1 MAG: outer membrane channel superfamily protein [Flavobacteriaceae bacterium CG_4_10_14_0_8_um_filter_34_31]
MKRIILVIFATCFAITTNAQGIDFGVKAGANFSTITDASGFDNKTGFHAGIFLGLKFTDKLALQPELLYSQQGAEFNAGKFDLDYVNIPVVLKLYLIQGLNLQVGPQFGFVVNDDITVQGIEGQVKTNDFDFSGVVGAGYDLPLGLRIDARYNFGLSDVIESESWKNGVFSLALGYSFL